MSESEEYFAHILMSIEYGLGILSNGLVSEAAGKKEARDDTCPDEEEAHRQGNEREMVFGVQETGSRPQPNLRFVLVPHECR